MNRRISATGAVLLLLVSACDADPGKGKSRAGVSDPAPVTQPTTRAATSEVYEFSQADSKVEFLAAKITRKHPSSFGLFTGRIESPDGKPESSVVSIEIDMASVTTDVPKLTAHLKTADFLDVEKFPKARFVSTAIKPGGEKGATHTVTGNLELHGITKSLTFPANIRMTPGGVEADAEFVVDRKDFGLVYPGLPDDAIKDDVAIKLTVRSKKASA